MSPHFKVTGVDLFDPFRLKYERNKSVKAWGAIFTCATVRAVHLEKVESSSSEAFLRALRRFAATHGWPETIISDNGSSFVDAEAELRKIIIDGRRLLEDFSTLHRFKWLFISPYSPHQAGLYESLIKQAKRALSVAVCNQTLTWSEMATLFAEVKSLLNSRPISHSSDDPNDVRALTPNYLLLGRAFPIFPMARTRKPLIRGNACSLFKH